jgi:DNA invertase Pin-like site-specific DNA recombinase
MDAGKRKRGRGKLTSEDVRKIRELCKIGETYFKIAFRFRVSRQTISDIDNRRTWKDSVIS